MNVGPKISLYPTRETLSVAVARHVALMAAQTIEERHCFTVALSGGSLIEILAPQLVSTSLRFEVNWSAWQVFWADERCVPSGSPDSNFGVADRLLLRYVSVPRDGIHAVDDRLGVAEAAEEYEASLRRVFRPEAGQFPRFDLILLGVGEDGHTASLFPGHPLLTERRRWVASLLDAPKPPAKRITLTLPVINNARHVVFVAAGAGKKSILSEVLGPGIHRKTLPAELVTPTDGDVEWFVDAAAAGDLRTRQGSDEK